MTTQTKIKLKRMAKNLPIYFLMTVGIMVFVYFVLYRPYAIHQEKKDFEKAEATLNELYDKIVAKIGKPDQEKKVNKCSYSSSFSEFETRGDRSCDVAIYALYENKNAEQSNTIMKTASQIVGTSQIRKVFGSQQQNAFVPIVSPSTQQSFAQDYNNVSGLRCGVSYSYPIEAGLYEVFKPKAAESIEIELSCYGSARAEHYPVSN
ncbi:hypothetical protein A3D14_03615 [Candidatus Saccharibacteria bacterium RIFCSPHIGHO2_02_FULL_47_12]|nr:MAG: hypothetical protein A3D14_03615 [Candidatus Saccharibacteria bacterium RIFCSPHIGHO2_02_FULL_47_12]